MVHMSDGGDNLSVCEVVERAIALLEKAEALRLEALRKAEGAVASGQLSRLKKYPSSILGSAQEMNGAKFGFDVLARPLVQVAYALKIDAAPLDDFIRTGKPTFVPGAIRVLRMIQGEDHRRSVPVLTGRKGTMAGEAKAAVGDITVHNQVIIDPGAVSDLVCMKLADQHGATASAGGSGKPDDSHVDVERTRKHVGRAESMLGHMKSWYGIIFGTVSVISAIGGIYLWYVEHLKNPLTWFFWFR